MLMYLAGLHACELLEVGVVTRHTSTQFSCLDAINVLLVELFEIKEAAGRLGPPDSTLTLSRLSWTLAWIVRS